MAWKNILGRVFQRKPAAQNEPRPEAKLGMAGLLERFGIRGAKHRPLPEVRLEQKPTEGYEYSPRFFIRHAGRMVGFIARGQRELFEMKGLGIFTASLKKLEEHEMQAFRSGHFNDYKSEMAQRIFVHSLAGKVASLEKLAEPHFIDFTHRPDVAIRLMKNGYELVPESRKALENSGLKQTAGRQETMEFLAQKKLPFAYVLVKPAKETAT